MAEPERASCSWFNPRIEQAYIQNRLRRLAEVPINLNDDSFFAMIATLGCLVNLISSPKSFSPTDCCNTNERIWELFEPTSTAKYEIKTDQELWSILNDPAINIYNFEWESPKSPYHNFIVVKYNKEWYILQSYTQTYELKIDKGGQLPNYLVELLTTDSVEVYNILFGTRRSTNRPRDGESLYVVTTGYFDQLPIHKLTRFLTQYEGQ